jgi:hypothetical protein
MRIGWMKLQQILARIIASTEIEAMPDSIAYHACERGGELRFSQSAFLRRHY